MWSRKRIRMGGRAGAVLVVAMLLPDGVVGQEPSHAGQFRGGPARSGAYPTEHGRALAGMAWRYATRGMVVSSPTVAGGRVFVGGGDGRVRALDLARGTELWSVHVGAPVSCTPAVAGGRVHLMDREGTLHTLDAATGDPLWEVGLHGEARPFPWGHESGDQYTPSPLAVGDTLFVTAADGYLRALDGATGGLLWATDLGARIVASPATDGSRIVVGDAAGLVHAVDRTGERLWAFETLGASLRSSEFGFDRRTLQSSPAVVDGRVFVGSRDGKLYALDAATGGELWRADHGTSWVNTSPAVADGTVYAGSSDAAFVQALDAETGRELWRTGELGLVWASPAVAGEVLYVASWSGRLRALDRRTGEVLWAFPLDGMILSSPVAVGGLVLFGGADGGLYALRTAERGPSRYVFHDASLDRATRVPAPGRLATSLESFGYERVDADGLPALLGELADSDGESVVVFATDHLPDPGENGERFRRYLESGGKVVWPGGPPPLLWPLDPSTGSPGRYGDVAWDRTSELLDVDHDRAIFDMRGVRPTPEGVRWGLEGWWRQAWGVDPAGVTRVLAVDDWGLAASWVREYGGGPGTGFVLVPADEWFYVIVRAAEFRPAAAHGGGR